MTEALAIATLDVIEPLMNADRISIIRSLIFLRVPVLVLVLVLLLLILLLGVLVVAARQSIFESHGSFHIHIVDNISIAHFIGLFRRCSYCALFHITILLFQLLSCFHSIDYRVVRPQCSSNPTPR